MCVCIYVYLYDILWNPRSEWFVVQRAQWLLRFARARPRRPRCYLPCPRSLPRPLPRPMDDWAASGPTSGAMPWTWKNCRRRTGCFFGGGKRLKHSESGRTYGRGKAAVVPFQSEHITVLVLMVFPSFCQICRGAILSRPVCTFFLVFAWVFKGFQRWSCCWQCSIAHNVSAQMNHFTSYLYHYPVIWFYICNPLETHLGQLILDPPLPGS